MDEQDGLICAYALDGAGSGRRLGADQIDDRGRPEAPVWIHLDRRGAGTADWLVSDPGVSRRAQYALTAEDPRPRCDTMPGGVLLDLRGVNLSPGADPADMVALRVWIEDNRVITVRGRHLMAVDDLRAEFEAGTGPRTVGEIVTTLAARLVERMAPVLSRLDEQIDELEEQVLNAKEADLQLPLGEIRSRIVRLRRYIGPQREALFRLINLTPGWVSDTDRDQLHEVANSVSRYIDELDAARERALVLQDELARMLSLTIDRIVYTLTIVAVIFLPLDLIATLFGLAMETVPFLQDRPMLFFALVGGLAVIALVEIRLFKRIKWL